MMKCYMPIYYLTININVLAAVTDAVSSTLTLFFCQATFDFH